MLSPRLVSILIVTVVVVGGRTSAHYDTSLGRWLERDPAGYVDGMNLYEAFRSNPTFADPGGMFTEPPRELSCPGGVGRQVTDPDNDCDRCCTAICSGAKGRGRSGCCGKNAIGCICGLNTGRKYPGRRAKCYRERIEECTKNHEKRHTQDIDCSGNEPDRILGRDKKDIPWSDSECGGICSECEAHKVSEECVNNIDCNSCGTPGEKRFCQRNVDEDKRFYERSRREWCKRCEECKRRKGSRSECR